MLARLAPMRILGAVPAILLVTLALAGCGSSSDETTGSNPPANSSPAPARPEAPAGSTAAVCKGSAAAGGELRVTGVSCEMARQVAAGWFKDGACAGAPGASRTSCHLGAFTCLGAATDRGIAVTCAAPGRSLSFVAKPD
jgi:hypothetical protein